MRIAILALLLSGCSVQPAVLAFHASQPSETSSDVAVDMLGAGGCFEKGGTSVCAFAGPRRLAYQGRSNTSAGVQVMTLHKWKTRSSTNTH